jgi:3-hydroxybutyryl-CoA dehydrogenase
MTVRTIAVIGAGAVGREIAYASVLAGYKTILEDIFPGALEQAIAWIERSLDEDVARGRVGANVRDAALAKLSTAGSVEDAVREADLIIETVADEMEMKIELFTIFDKFAKPLAIFASSSSSFSITEMAAVTFCAERCIGMRFLDAAPKPGLLELVRGLQTADETVSICREVAQRMGREVTVVREPDPNVRGCAELKSAGAQD